MKSPPKPIKIPDDIAARCTGPSQAKRMDALLRKVIAAPRPKRDSYAIDAGPKTGEGVNGRKAVFCFPAGNRWNRIFRYPS